MCYKAVKCWDDGDMYSFMDSDIWQDSIHCSLNALLRHSVTAGYWTADDDISSYGAYFFADTVHARSCPLIKDIYLNNK